ncbi:hypothetical protein FGO68_gene5829 [Halteria grandinella]|uniref:Uncharacterized protein n=1 Tax=Halteria grandinella TaxID=5974 RepID=A0A8J8NVV5_HALGN|nr:hypothetical protein FGO68_gene5829 [Halteria grandinella]
MIIAILTKCILKVAYLFQILSIWYTACPFILKLCIIASQVNYYVWFSRRRSAFQILSLETHHYSQKFRPCCSTECMLLMPILFHLNSRKVKQIAVTGGEIIVCVTKMASLLWIYKRQVLIATHIAVTLKTHSLHGLVLSNLRRLPSLVKGYPRIILGTYLFLVEVLASSFKLALIKLELRYCVNNEVSRFINLAFIL